MLVGATGDVLRLEGIAYTEGAVSELRIAVWAQGEQVATHPEWQLEPLQTAAVAPGKTFSLDLPGARLPLVVEVAADGHVAVALEVLMDEQRRLPPAWLRRGEPLTVRVTRGGKAAQDALIWGDLSLLPGTWDPRRWSAVIPRTAVPADGLVATQRPADHAKVALRGITQEGEFGTVVFPGALPASTRTIALDSVPIEVRVVDRRGRPAVGVSLIEASSPALVAAVTNDEGRATIQVPARDQWQILALSDDVMGRIVGHEIPETEIELRLQPRAEIELRWSSELGPLALRLRGLPAALGGTPRRHRSAQASLPLVGGMKGGCSFWGPSVSFGEHEFEDPTEPVVLDARAPVRIDGRVTAPEGVAVSSLPVWVRITPPWMRRDMAWMGPRPGPLARPWLPWAVTDGRGRFSLTGLPAVELELEVRAQGFPPAMSQRLTGQPGASLETEIMLIAGASVSLQVVDPDHAPLEGAVVEVFKSQPRSAMGRIRFRGMPGSNPETVGATDIEGRISLDAIPVGLVRLRVSRPGSVVRTFDQVQVPAEGLDYGEVVLVPGVTIHGTTVGPDGEPVADAEVALTRTPQAPRFRPTTVSGPDGRFSIADIEPSSEIYLQASADGLVPEAPLKVALPPSEAVVVAMAEERVVAGVVLRAEDDLPVGDAQVIVAVSTAARGRGVSAVPVGRKTTDDLGAFRIDGLAEGHYELTVSATGRQPARQIVVVPADSDPEPVIIRLDPGLELRGRVETATGEPAIGLTVAAIGASSRITGGGSARERTSTRTSGDGSFAFDDLAPGDYQLEVRSEDGHAADATATAGQPEEVVLRLDAGEVLTGVVLSEDGAPIVAAEVAVFSASRSGPPPVGVTDDSGRFRLKGIRGGTVTVFAMAEGYIRGSEKVEVVAGKGAELELQLKRGATVVGKVSGLAGSDLEQCSLFSDQGGRAKPASDGSFTLTGVEAGEREISAYLQSDGRRRSVRVTVPEEGVSEPVVIDFAAGVTLSGQVLRNGSGVQGMTVSASGVGVRALASTVSEVDGTYRLDGLEPGEYEIAALSRAGESLAGEHVLLETDAELDLMVPSGRLSGWVLEADSDRPIEGATVTVSGSGLPAVARTVVTDASGSFSVDDLPSREYRVAAEATGRAPAQEMVSLQESVPYAVTLRLGVKEATVLVVREPDGSPAQNVIIMSSQNRLTGPSFYVSCAGDGRCQVRDLPAGEWTLLVRGQGAALTRVSVPTGEVPVTLRSRGELIIRSSADETGAAWQVRVSDIASGLVVPMTEWRNPGRSEWVPVPAHGLKLWLPEGGWRVEAYDPEGTLSTREANVDGGGSTSIELR
jgi:hypothetical protein